MITPHPHLSSCLMGSGARVQSKPVASWDPSQQQPGSYAEHSVATTRSICLLHGRMKPAPAADPPVYSHLREDEENKFPSEKARLLKMAAYISTQMIDIVQNKECRRTFMCLPNLILLCGLGHFCHIPGWWQAWVSPALGPYTALLQMLQRDAQTLKCLDDFLSSLSLS